jgi:hypothetical protein
MPLALAMDLPISRPDWFRRVLAISAAGDRRRVIRSFTDDQLLNFPLFAASSPGSWVTNRPAMSICLNNLRFAKSSALTKVLYFSICLERQQNRDAAKRERLVNGF